MIQKLKNIAHWGLAVLANVRYGFPARRITVVGVTGTDGKTTTTSLVYHILNSAGRKAAMVTTVGAYINGQMRSTGFHVTTPTSFALQKFLSEAARTGHEFAVIETSSHGIDQSRIWGIPYRVAAITNITHEHLDYHPSFEEYAETKLRFLRSVGAAVLNLDDPLVASSRGKFKNKVVTYSRNGAADLTVSSFAFETKLFGSFNQSNILAAVGICRELGIADELIRAGIRSFSAPPGRQEIVHDGEYKVMVDFAHTPNAVESVLREVKATSPRRLVHLFGAPGHRDQSKRPLMGAASDRYADVMIITADDPRTEKVADVIGQIRRGVSPRFVLGKNLFEIEDRMKAIEFAIAQAQPGDFIVLTGKGHEPTLALADREMPWNEREIVLGVIKKSPAR
jgi:UDP-N-acetylmuramoyl-L-alanyl-D-glutamate--2,6-diaminopimelate ligase